MSSRNPDRREDGGRHIETRLSGWGVPDMPEPLVRPPPPPPPPPAVAMAVPPAQMLAPPPPPGRPTGGLETEGAIGFGTSRLRDQQEQIMAQQQQGGQSSEPSPMVRALEHLYEKSAELKEENEELRGQVDALVDSVQRLNSFVRASLDFLSDEDHSADFMRSHLDRFFELLRENGLSTEKEKEKEKGEDGDVRGDIANRLNNIN